MSGVPVKTNLATLLQTAVAPAIWGSTYIVTTEFLAGFPPITVAVLRALPAGLLLLAITRQLPRGIWWLRVFVLGALNFSIFLSLLFIAAYRLPGGVAATVGAIQPLLVVFLARAFLGSPIRALSIGAAVMGAAGVALMVLTPRAALDPVGIIAGLIGAASMASGIVLNRKWQPPVPALTFTAWQLTAGGLLLVPVVLFFAPAMPLPTVSNLLALGWLGLIGMALTYLLWLRGIAKLGPATAAPLLLLSPVTAVILGWLCLSQTLSALQILGGLLVIGSIWLGQRAGRSGGGRINAGSTLRQTTRAA